jgi:hypothetical protein
LRLGIAEGRLGGLQFGMRGLQLRLV